MGGVCSCLKFCCCCCYDQPVIKWKSNSPGSKRSETTKSDEEKGPHGRRGSPLVLTEFKTKDEEEESVEPRTIEDKQPRERSKDAIFGGASGYANIRAKEKEKIPKKLTEDQKLAVAKRFCGRTKLKLLGLLGTGCYANVYEVYSKEKNKNLALKIIDEQRVAQYYRKFFLTNEIKFLKKCAKTKRHKNIIRIFEVLSYMDRVMIIMEVAKNGTLADLLMRFGTLSEVDAYKMFVQIFDAVKWMHDLNIAHRDLKLENILISGRHNPKVSDFSFTTEVDPNQPLSDQFCGTIPYFAPELLSHTPHNPLLADIWALGVCLFITLNDALPFPISDESVMLRKQLNRDWKHRKKVEPNLSYNLKSMITTMFEPDFRRRTDINQLLNSSWITSGVRA